jgi:ubiquinone/menaquinone biosynthesis C-methylase UbiE
MASNPGLKEIYTEHVSRGLNGRFHKYTHLKLESRNQKTYYSNVLEIGSGNGEHLKFITHNYSKYYMFDLVYPKKIIKSKRIKFVKGDVHKMPFKTESFDRIILTCVLHHLQDPMKALREISRVAKKGAEISILLPSDPGILFRLARFLFANKSLKKFEIENIYLLRALEHRNHYTSLDAMINSIFSNVSANNYPFFMKSYDLNLFTIYKIVKE